MDWIHRIQKAIDYIEQHLTDNISYEEIAKQSFSSPFHFQRVFGILCGYTLGEYIRNRRLTLAGKELFLGNKKIIDIALKYGYENPDSFSRAFSRFHGVTPSEVIRKSASLKSFLPLRLKISLEGGETMDYRIEEIRIPKQQYVVFETQRSSQPIEEYINIRQNLVTDWMPSSGYQFANSPELALLHWRPITEKNNRFVEMWIPVESID